MFISKIHLGVAAVVVVGLSLGLGWSVRENAQLRRELARSTAADPRTAELQRQVAAETQRVAAAEAKVAALLKSAEATSKAARAVASSAPGETITAQDLVKAALARAKELIAGGKFQEALDEYLKCYRELEAKRPGSSECQSLMSAIRALGRRHPPAIPALGELRDAAMAQHAAHPEKREYVFEIALLNQRLGEGSRTVALYDSLAPNDPARQSIPMIAYDAFVEGRHYADALAGRPLGNMLTLIEAGTQRLATQSGDLQAAMRKSIVDGTVVNIEALTGAGRLDDARMLTEKLLAFDGSEVTRAAIREHVERAGQPSTP